MKTRLDQLTTAEFIELVCGNSEVLLGKRETVRPYTLAIALRNIVMEYRSIADPGGNAAYLQRIDFLIKTRLSVAIYAYGQMLVDMQLLEDARDLLISAGHSAAGWNHKRIKSEVHIQLQKSRRIMDESGKDEKENQEDKEHIRDSFNSMIAAMMAHFKFQIDIATMMAPVFAHLVARYHAEIKAMKNAMNTRYKI